MSASSIRSRGISWGIILRECYESIDVSVIRVFVSVLLFVLSGSTRGYIRGVKRGFSPEFFVIYIFGGGSLIRSIVQMRTFFRGFMRRFNTFGGRLFGLIAIAHVSM